MKKKISPSYKDTFDYNNLLLSIGIRCVESEKPFERQEVEGVLINMSHVWLYCEETWDLVSSEKRKLNGREVFEGLEEGELRVPNCLREILAGIKTITSRVDFIGLKRKKYVFDGKYWNLFSVLPKISESLTDHDVVLKLLKGDCFISKGIQKKCSCHIHCDR